MIGEGSAIGARSEIGEGSKVGPDVVIGAGAADPIDLGYYEGYRKVIAQVNGVAYIGAGCQWLTLAAARRHWTGRKDRPITIAMLDFAEAIAKQRGWRIE